METKWKWIAHIGRYALCKFSFFQTFFQGKCNVLKSHKLRRTGGVNNVLFSHSAPLFHLSFSRMLIFLHGNSIRSGGI